MLIPMELVIERPASTASRLVYDIRGRELNDRALVDLICEGVEKHLAERPLGDDRRPEGCE